MPCPRHEPRTTVLIKRAILVWSCGLVDQLSVSLFTEDILWSKPLPTDSPCLPSLILPPPHTRFISCSTPSASVLSTLRPHDPMYWALLAPDLQLYQDPYSYYMPTHWPPAVACPHWCAPQGASCLHCTCRPALVPENQQTTLPSSRFFFTFSHDAMEEAAPFRVCFSLNTVSQPQDTM